MSPKDKDAKKRPPSKEPLPGTTGDPGGLPPPEDNQTDSKVETNGDPGGLPPPEDRKTG
jgi:hypothetical protein